MARPLGTAPFRPTYRVQPRLLVATLLRIGVDGSTVRLIAGKLPDKRRNVVRKRMIAIVGAAGLLVGCGAVGLSAPAGAAVAGLVRVDQVGYLPGDAKVAYLMAPGTVTGAKFAVVNSAGTTVLGGSVSGTSRGSWNSKYSKVYPITFSGLKTAGTYTLQGSGAPPRTPAKFRGAGGGAPVRPVGVRRGGLFPGQRGGVPGLP